MVRRTGEGGVDFMLAVLGAISLAGCFWAMIWEGEQCVGSVFCF